MNTIDERARRVLYARAQPARVPDELRTVSADYILALRLLSSIFYHGNFIAETDAERELEAAMRRLGYFAETEDQLMQIIKSAEAAMLKGATQPANLSPWRSIESAPKDGPTILLFAPSRGTDRLIYEGYWNPIANNFTMLGGFVILDTATHWMEKPQAPEAGDGV